MFYTTDKLRRSTYLCTSSGKQNQVRGLDFAQFVCSSSFFLSPKKGAVKKLGFLQHFFCAFLQPSAHPIKNFKKIAADAKKFKNNS